MIFSMKKHDGITSRARINLQLADLRHHVCGAM